MSLRYDGRTVVVTGVSNGFGRLYATHFAACGANIVVHDHIHKSLADDVVQDIRKTGNKAVANYAQPNDGAKLIEAAIQSFGRIDVLINNAGVTTNPSWEDTDRTAWEALLEDNFKLAYKCINTAWPYFKKQTYGRIISTASVASLSAKGPSPLYSTGLYGQLGFMQTIAREGAKYNILASTLGVGSTNGKPNDSGIQTLGVLRTITLLTHETNTSETGHLYSLDGAQCRKFRWQRSEGAFLNPDAGLSPGSILEKWATVNDFSRFQYPASSADFRAVVAKARRLVPSRSDKMLRFDGKVVLVTGAGSGLGRAYALHFASLRARVVLNDLNDPSTVAAEIKRTGGKALVILCSVLDGNKIIADTIKEYGRIDVVINNAGFVRDKSIANMTDKLWDPIMDVHLNGMYRVTKAAWPFFVSQGYGRVVNISSTSGIYGNFGQSNYSLAKCAIVGFSQALASAGAQHQILVNAVAPVASTPALAVAVQGSSTEVLPQYCAPFVGLMCSDSVPYPCSGGLYEIGGGWHARTRLEANKGITWQETEELGEETVSNALQALAEFRPVNKSYPGEDELKLLSQKVQRSGVLTRIEIAKSAPSGKSYFDFSQRDAILYNLTLGAKSTELSFVYERNKEFQVIPTFGAIPWFRATLPFSFDDIVPNWDPLKFLHGEIFLEVRKYPIPAHGRLVTYPRLLHVLDKKKAAVVTTAYTTQDVMSGEDIFYNESSIYVRDSGNFGGPSHVTPAIAESKVPSWKPNFEREEKTNAEQAAFYRLNGDTNDLHIDPEVARRSGYERPILHGLCFFGISGKHIFQQYGRYKSIRVRFAGIVLPGQTLRTEAWRNPDDHVVLFQMRVFETGKLCISGGRAELLRPTGTSKL